MVSIQSLLTVLVTFLSSERAQHPITLIIFWIFRRNFAVKRVVESVYYSRLFVRTASVHQAVSEGPL